MCPAALAGVARPAAGQLFADSAAEVVVAGPAAAVLAVAAAVGLVAAVVAAWSGTADPAALAGVAHPAAVLAAAVPAAVLAGQVGYAVGRGRPLKCPTVKRPAGGGRSSCRKPSLQLSPRRSVCNTFLYTSPKNVEYIVESYQNNKHLNQYITVVRIWQFNMCYSSRLPVDATRGLQPLCPDSGMTKIPEVSSGFGVIVSNHC